MSRVCACPRGEPMDGMPRSVKYRHGERCRKAAWRAKVQTEAKAAGLPSSLTLESVHATSSTNGRDGHAESAGKPRQRRRVELRISYRKAVEVLLEAYAPESHRLDIEAVLAEALTPKQREALKETTP